MQSSFSKIYITTPIFYPSDKPHIGHAFTLVMADVLKRYYQLIKIDSFLLTGTDEHGEKILKKSQENQTDTQEFVDKHAQNFKVLCEKFNINIDCFARTSDEKHKQYVQKTFSALFNKNNIYFGKWDGYYCVSCEENYSAKEYSQSTKCALHHELSHREEETFFLKVKGFEIFLQDLYTKNPTLIYPDWYTKELNNSFINNLEDLSLTRQKLNWGIKTIEKPDFTIYVWFDALLTYISADKYNLWDKPETKIVHIIGKDILRFHAIYWPLVLSFLQKKNYHKLITHGWILMDKNKMSKSLGNVVDPIDLLDSFSLDVLRFFLVNLNWKLDNKFLLNDINLTNNTYLSNLFGNIIFRFFGLIKKNNYFVDNIDSLEPNEHLDGLDQKINDLCDKFKTYIMSEDIPDLLSDLFTLLRDGNKVIDLLKPWTFHVDSNIYKTMMIVMYKISCFSVFILSPILIETALTIAEKLSFDLKNFDIDSFKDIKNFKNKQTQEVSEPFFKRMDVNKE